MLEVVLVRWWWELAGTWCIDEVGKRERKGAPAARLGVLLVIKQNEDYYITAMRCQLEDLHHCDGITGNRSIQIHMSAWDYRYRHFADIDSHRHSVNECSNCSRMALELCEERLRVRLRIIELWFSEALLSFSSEMDWDPSMLVRYHLKDYLTVFGLIRNYY